MKRKNYSPYESHGRTAICALCKETVDEKAVKIFMYTSKTTKNELGLNVCRHCENKKEELEQLAIKIFIEKNQKSITENELDDLEGSNIC